MQGCRLIILLHSIDRDSGLEQVVDTISMSPGSRVVQRRLPGVIHTTGIGTSCQQLANVFPSPRPRGVHEGILSVLIACFKVFGGRRYLIQHVVLRCQHDNRGAFVISCVGVGSVGNQDSDIIPMVVIQSQQQRGPVVHVAGVDIGTLAERVEYVARRSLCGSFQ